MFTFRRIRAANSDLAQVQDNLVDVFNKLALVPLLDGALLTNIVFTGATTKTIAHTLTRQPVGWIITDKTAAVTIYRTGWDSRTITLTSSGATSIAVWIF